jgi:hypothetical protein
MRVLFIHGLESGPNGRKARLLRLLGHKVFVPDMRLLYRQSVRRGILLSVIGVAIGLCITHSLLHLYRGQLLMSCLAMAVLYFIFRYDLDRGFAKSTLLVTKEICKFHPDVVVGSSYGSAVLIRLIAIGVWTGPSLILSSVHNFLHCNLIPVKPGGPILLVHGTGDHICSMHEVQKLTLRYLSAGINAKLVIEPDDHALRDTFTRNQINGYLRFLQPTKSKMEPLY